ncbi:MFS transporter [Motilibacter aurantiacus]|uniref:MFS transporter n=1 Tax=Motilibacter aurantiacus TaxID=2714955 RepID=UPI00140E28EE|nr:MFS transporter [Motilibacter aurantiacus]NHC46703.1 MFS transporter [Motilibacter aurantiacus]
MTTQTAPPPVAHTHGNTHAHFPSWAVLLIACAAQFMVILDVSIVNVALPSMQHDLRLTTDGLQWVVNAYTLTFAGFLLFGGRAADLFGRKRVFLFGLVVFTLASLVGGFAQDEATIVAARAVQGLGGAVLAPATLSLLTTTYTEPHARARALGIWGSVVGAGGALGALAGGVLTDLLSWRWVLFVNGPIGLALLVGAVVVLLESKGQARGVRSLDIPGTATVTLGLTAIVYAIVSTDTYAWGSARTLVPLVAGIALLGVFLLVESRSRQPLVPLAIFRLRALSAANGVAAFVGGGMFAYWFFLTLYLQQVHGYSPLAAGFAFLPSSVSIVIASQISGKLVRRVGPRPLLVVGPLLTATGLAWLSRFSADGSYATDVLPATIALSLGLGLTMVPMTVAATAGVGPREAGLASGLLNTSRQVGGAVGLAVLSTIANTHAAGLRDAGRPVAEALTAGYGRGLLVSAGILVLAGVAGALLPGRARQQA